MAEEQPLDDVDGIIEGCRDKVIAVARAIVGDEDLAEEVAQEALLLTVRNVECIRDASHFEAYACSTARSRALNVKRDLARHRELLAGASPPPDGLEPRSRNDPFEDVVLAELVQSIDAFVDQLLDSRRRIWDLSFVEELPAQEVAARLHIVPKTVANERAIIKSELRAWLASRR